jgi:hypothetical protein
MNAVTGKFRNALCTVPGEGYIDDIYTAALARMGQGKLTARWSDAYGGVREFGA